MKIQDQAFVAISYTLTVDGQTADHASKESPLRFVFGTGYLLPKFEENLLGMEPGGTFKFTLSPEDGYGTVDSRLVIDVPKQVFTINGVVQEEILKVGAQVPMMTGDGARVTGVIVAIEGESVRMDFNHPMAGKTLNFEGEILEVREATDDDYPHSQCGSCDCGSCQGGCDGGCGGGCE